jgi:putative transposase
MSYVKIWIHCVWGTKKRTPFLTQENLVPILSHIRENAVKKGIYINFINGHKEHIHALLSLNPKQCIADVLQLIKGESSFWMNKNNICKGKFEWADEYFAVSISHSQLDSVRDYIKMQAEHHKLKTWDEECGEFLDKYGFSMI